MTDRHRRHEQQVLAFEFAVPEFIDGGCCACTVAQHLADRALTQSFLCQLVGCPPRAGAHTTSGTGSEWRGAHTQIFGTPLRTVTVRGDISMHVVRPAVALTQELTATAARESQSTIARSVPPVIRAKVGAGGMPICPCVAPVSSKRPQARPSLAPTLS